MKKLILFLTLTAQLALGMDNKPFEKLVHKYAAQFGYEDPAGYPYTVIQVSLEALQHVTQTPSLAVSWWDKDNGWWVAWVLNDKGLDDLADRQGFHHMTLKQKHETQKLAIVHEMIHGWGLDENLEGAVQHLASIFLYHDYRKRPLPSDWRKAPPKQEEPKDPAVPPEVLEMLKRLGVTLE